MRQSGIVVHWNDEKGYGFIEPDSGGERIFVDITSFKRSQRRPELADYVTFKLSADKNGRLCAVSVKRVEKDGQESTGGHSGNAPVLFASVFLGLLTIETMFEKVHLYIFVYYYLMSFVTFAVYGKDKWVATRGAWRTSEQNLHFLAIIGGWPGALIAQQIFRHKSQKQSFRTVLKVTVVINCILFAWLVSPYGQEYFQVYVLDRLSAQ